MLLRLQKTDIDVVCTTCNKMHIADMLSQAYLPYCDAHDLGDHVFTAELQQMNIAKDVDQRDTRNNLQVT